MVLISSAGAQRGFPATSVYNAVKAGVRSLGRPEEIAATILFLASDDASFYTDGGTRDI